MKNNKFKLLLTGGGTGGSVTPLLAIADELKIKSKNFDFFWIGTKGGPEKAMVEKDGIKFTSISAGKFRRYFSLKNIIDPFKIVVAFFQSIFIIERLKPDLILSAGSFVSVPVIWAGWFLGKKILIHQQDARPGFANKLMAPFADLITVSLKESLDDYGEKAVWTGNPIRLGRETSISKSQIPNDFGNNLPLILIVGGGTGAAAINELVFKNINKLAKIANIVHITGMRKSELNSEASEFNSGYYRFDFLPHVQMMAVMEKADLVVSRAGMGFLTEISYLKKPAIIIPMPDSHQEENAKIFTRQNAAVILNQKELTAKTFMDKLHELLNNEAIRWELGENAGKVMKKKANEEMVKIITKLLDLKF